MTTQSVREAWLWQAAACQTMNAPFTAALLRCMVEDDEAASALAPHLEPVKDLSSRALLIAATPLRLLGGLHYAVLSGAAPELARLYASGETQDLGRLVAAVAGRQGETLQRFMASPPQTNEVRRSLCLFGGFLEIARAAGLPLRCVELGASAGLNMNWDLYRFDLGEGRVWGPLDAGLVLSGAWTGGPPPLDAKIEILEKRGCDRAPIDVRSEEGALRLQAYVWPDQSERLERVRRAIDVARKTPIRVEAADAGAFTAAAADPAPGVATVIYHSVFLQYPSPEARAAIIAAIRDQGARARSGAPLAWLRMEPKAESPADMEVRLTMWPGGDERRLADVHSHGASVHWLG